MNQWPRQFSAFQEANQRLTYLHLYIQITICNCNQRCVNLWNCIILNQIIGAKNQVAITFWSHSEALGNLQATPRPHAPEGIATPRYMKKTSFFLCTILDVPSSPSPSIATHLKGEQRVSSSPGELLGKHWFTLTGRDVPRDVDGDFSQPNLEIPGNETENIQSRLWLNHTGLRAVLCSHQIIQTTSGSCIIFFTQGKVSV